MAESRGSDNTIKKAGQRGPNNVEDFRLRKLQPILFYKKDHSCSFYKKKTLVFNSGAVFNVQKKKEKAKTVCWGPFLALKFYKGYLP